MNFPLPKQPFVKLVKHGIFSKQSIAERDLLPLFDQSCGIDIQSFRYNQQGSQV